MCKVFVHSSQVRHSLKKVDAMNDDSNPALGHLFACKFTVELVNGIKFVGSPSQPMDFKRHNARKWMSGLSSFRFGNQLQLPEATFPSAHGCKHMAKAFH